MIQLRVLSLGAGVQSTTMALMAARGDVGPMPDCAIFADPGWESKATYDYLEYLIPMLPFPVHRVSAGNIRDDLLARSSARSGRFVTVPFFLKHPNGKDGIGRRQCTSHYKVEPIHKKVRELLGKGPRDRIAPCSIEMWVGISVDEVVRATLSKLKYEVKRFPLLEARMNRNDCNVYLRDRQIRIPPKSACVGCPFHSNEHWRAIRDGSPEEWRDAIEVDGAIRNLSDSKIRGQQFMHRQLVPLVEVDLSSAEDRGQLNLFINECEGMCGV